MFGSYRHNVAATLGVVGVVTFSIGFALQPEKPHLAGESGYRKQSPAYQAGGTDCEQSRFLTLRGIDRERKISDCREAEEQHREAADNVIEARRSASAADASAVAAYQQAWIAAWGAAFVAATLIAAIGAAIFAERAAFHTMRSADVAERQLAEADRPYLILIESNLAGIADINCIEPLGFTYKFLNVGRGPALMSRYAIIAYHHDTFEELNYNKQDCVFAPSTWAISPNANWSSIRPSVFELSTEVRKGIINGTSFLSVVITAYYTSCIDRLREYESTICLEYQRLDGRLIPVERPFSCYI